VGIEREGESGWRSGIEGKVVDESMEYHIIYVHDTMIVE